MSSTVPLNSPTAIKSPTRLLHNVNKNLYEEYLENPQEEYEIEVVTDSIDSAALKQEKERLLKRIKEIDHVLNCEG